MAGNLRTSPLPSAEVAGDGKVYVAWQDCSFRSGCTSNDIVYSTSMDGVAWTAKVRVPIDPTTSGVDHFIPGFAVDRSTSGSSTRLALGYYYYPVADCSAATCQLTVGFVSSTDGGATWTQPRQVAGPINLAWIASTNQGVMVGDYMSTSFAGGNYAFPIFAVAKAKTGAVVRRAHVQRAVRRHDASRAASSARGTTASGSRSTTWCPTSSYLRSRSRNEGRSGLTSGATWGREGAGRGRSGPPSQWRCSACSSSRPSPPAA